MAKENKTNGGPAAGGVSQAEIDAIRAQALKASENKQERSDDAVGYWVPEAAPIHCTPIMVKVFDSKIDAAKPTELVFAQLDGPTVIDDTGTKTQRVGKKGEIVGIWYKPGMRGIVNCAGVSTVITLNPESEWKDTGKASKMKTFTVKADAGGKPLRITSDSRDKSKGVATAFDVVQAPKADGPSSEDIPF